MASISPLPVPSRSPWKRLSIVSRPMLAARAIWVSGFCGVTFTSKDPAARSLAASFLLMASAFLISLRLLVRHGRHLAGKRVLEAEVAQIPHPLREEDAVEMIDFMLHDPRMESLDAAIDRRPVQVEPLITDPAVARHQAAHPRDREASLPPLILLGVERHDKRVDEDRIWDRRDVRIARIVFELEDHRPQAHSDLRRCDTRTMQRAHGLVHVGNQLGELCIEARYRVCNLAQQRLTHLQNPPDCHGRQYPRRALAAVRQDIGPDLDRSAVIAEAQHMLAHGGRPLPARS